MQENIDNSDEISLSELIQKIKDWYSFLKTKWKQILLVGFIGGCIGFVYAWMQPIKYTAKTSFIVEEGKASSGGGLAALAGQFGFDFSSGSGASIFTGDNILIYLKSESLIRETLLTNYENKTNFSLADKYAEIYELRRKWAKSKKVGVQVFFPSKENYKFSILQDSLLKIIIKNIIEKQIIVERPEKKATFINVAVTFEDQVLSKLFCERIVKLATNKYIEIKTTRQQSNVDKLQRRADSLEYLLK
jgi:uncharacterized protein involved in exopolysaccharide biosynthesis